MKKQGMGGSAFFVGVGWLGLPAGAVCRSPAYLHEKEYYTAFLWVAIIKRKVCIYFFKTEKVSRSRKVLFK